MRFNSPSKKSQAVPKPATREPRPAPRKPNASLPSVLHTFAFLVSVSNSTMQHASFLFVVLLPSHPTLDPHALGQQAVAEALNARIAWEWTSSLWSLWPELPKWERGMVCSLNTLHVALLFFCSCSPCSVSDLVHFSFQHLQLIARQGSHNSWPQHTI